MITIHFHKSLQQLTQVKSHSFDVEDFTSLKQGLFILFPEVKNYFQSLANFNLKETIVLITEEREILDPKWYARDRFPENTTNLWLVPTIFGSGKQAGLIIGVALVALALFAIPYAGGAAGAAGSGIMGGYNALLAQGGMLAIAAKVTLGIGINLILATLLQFFAPKVEGDKDSNRRNNDAFDALVNTTVNGTIVALNYGLIRVAGQIVSASVTTIEHDENRIVSVSEFFN